MVIDDIDKVKELQKDHGEWSECMSNVSNLLPHTSHIDATQMPRLCHTQVFCLFVFFIKMCTKVNYTYLEIGRLNVRRSI